MIKKYKIVNFKVNQKPQFKWHRKNKLSKILNKVNK